MERKWRMTWKLRLYRGLHELGFPKIRGTFFGVPIIRITIFWGLYWGPFLLGNYHLLRTWAMNKVR